MARQNHLETLLVIIIIIHACYYIPIVGVNIPVKVRALVVLLYLLLTSERTWNMLNGRLHAFHLNVFHSPSVTTPVCNNIHYYYNIIIHACIYMSQYTIRFTCNFHSSLDHLFNEFIHYRL